MIGKLVHLTVNISDYMKFDIFYLIFEITKILNLKFVCRAFGPRSSETLLAVLVSVGYEVFVVAVREIDHFTGPRDGHVVYHAVEFSDRCCPSQRVRLRRHCTAAQLY